MSLALCLPPSLRNTDLQERISIPYHCRSPPWRGISSPHWSQPSHCLPSPRTPLQLNSSTPDLSMDFSWKKCFLYWKPLSLFLRQYSDQTDPALGKLFLIQGPLQRPPLSEAQAFPGPSRQTKLLYSLTVPVQFLSQWITVKYFHPHSY